MPELKIDDLNNMYRSAEQIDSSIFSEMKSNVRLVAGDHYLKGMHKDLERSKYAKRLSSDAKLRLTQNHISKASNIWVNSIINDISDVHIDPNNIREQRDKKAAELFQSVKEYISKEEKFDSRRRKFAKDYWDIGECAVKIFFDPTVGPMVDGEIKQDINPLTGEIITYQEQFPTGSIKFERILPFDLLRDPGAKEWEECRWVIYRKMMDKKELLAQFPGDENEEKRRMIQSSSEDTYKVYNGSNNDYSESKKVLIKEYYFRPCAVYPKGYFYVTTPELVLYEGELPAGIFPIEVLNFDEIPTTPRGRSKIKQLRPIQGEINRAVSKMAEHQITLGDDKLIIPAGSKIQESNKIAGVRAIQVAGISPTILEGRAGNQYVDYWLAQVNQFYKIAEIPEIEEDKISQMDVMSIIYRGMREKKKFSYYSEKFESFIINCWEKALRLFKFHISPYAAIPAIGRHEIINIDELKSSDDLGFQIKIKRRADDPESMIARHTSLTQFIQYAGDKLTDVDVAEVAANLPFLDKESFMPEAKVKHDRATNMILKLDRGKEVGISTHDDPAYMIRRLDRRMSESDFDFITAKADDGTVIPADYIKQLYEYTKNMYLQLEANQMMAKKARESDQIPTTGAAIEVQMNTNELRADGSGYKSVRLEFPHDSLLWLKETLMQQGVSEQTLSGFQEGTQQQLNQSMAGPGKQDVPEEVQRMYDQTGQPPQLVGH